MNERDIEVKLLVMEERLRTQAHHLKDVDECCGKLKGSSSQEFKILTERVIALEQNMNTNCHDVEVNLNALSTHVKDKGKEYGEDIISLTDEINKIHDKYFTFSIGILSALVIAIISLFIK